MTVNTKKMPKRQPTRPTAAPPLSHAPWPEGLAPAARDALALADVATLPQETVDVAVIGAGVTGLNAALAARAAGARVVVLEAAEAIGAGATGRNAGILSAGINMGLADLPPDGPEAAFWPTTTRALLALVAEAARPDALLVASLTGSISLAERPGAARHLAREARARQAAGLRADLWTPAQVAEATGGRLATASVVSALWLPDEGRIHPLTLLAHLARRAGEAGVALMGGARVAAYETACASGGAPIWRLRLADGQTLAARGLIVAVGPTAAPNARIYALAFAIDLPDTFPLFWDAAPYTYSDYRPGSGRVVVSGGRYGRAGATTRDAHYHAQLTAAARHWLPELAERPPTHAWAVDLAVAADLVPQLRDLGERAPGLAVEGLGALGVLPGTVLGQRAGETVARRLAR